MAHPGYPDEVEGYGFGDDHNSKAGPFNPESNIDPNDIVIDYEYKQRPTAGGPTTPGDVSVTEEGHKDEFGRAVEYWLSCIGYAVGYGNIWRFPYLLFSNGGGAFLVPYFIGLLTISLPMYVMETAYG